MRAAAGLALVLAVALAASVADARIAGPLARAVLLRIHGHVGPAREGERGLADLVLRHGRSTIRLHVEEIWVLSGDLVGMDVLREVEPYTPNMSVSGPRELLDRLAKAPPDAPLEVDGYYRPGARILMLSAVERRKAP